MDKAYQDKHNKGLDMLQDYKSYLEKQVQNLKKLDEKSEFMKSWNENTIKEKLEEIMVIDKILKSLIRFQNEFLKLFFGNNKQKTAKIASINVQ